MLPGLEPPLPAATSRCLIRGLVLTLAFLGICASCTRQPEPKPTGPTSAGNGASPETPDPRASSDLDSPTAQLNPSTSSTLAAPAVWPEALGFEGLTELPGPLYHCVERQGDQPVLHVEWANQSSNRWLLINVEGWDRRANDRFHFSNYGQLSGYALGMRFPPGRRSLQIPLAPELSADPVNGPQYCVSVVSVRCMTLKVAKDVEATKGWGSSASPEVLAVMYITAAEIPEYCAVQLLSQPENVSLAIPGAMIVELPQGTFPQVFFGFSGEARYERFVPIP